MESFINMNIDMERVININHSADDHQCDICLLLMVDPVMVSQ